MVSCTRHWVPSALKEAGVTSRRTGRSGKTVPLFAQKYCILIFSPPARYRGRNFPENWIWIQANHFPNAVGSSISISIARIPFYGLVFPGFIIGFWHQGVLHRFTTYVQATLERVHVNDEKVHVQVRNSTHRLMVEVVRAPTALLHMPTKTEGMVAAVKESVGAEATIQFFRLMSNADDDDELVFEGTSHHGGLEVHGDVSLLLCGD